MVKQIKNPATSIPYFRYNPATQTTTNAYVNHTRNFIWIADLTKLTIVIRETNVNAITWSIDVSHNSTNWINIKTDQALAKNATTYETLTDVWRYIRLQIKSTVADAHGTVDMYIMGERM